MHRRMRHLVREAENTVNMPISTNCYSFYLTLTTAKRKVIFKYSKKWGWRRSEQFTRRSKGTASKCSKKEANHNFLRGVTTADFATEKKMEDTDVDEDKCLLLFLLPFFRQFNYEQKFLARMEILKITRHVKLQQNFDTYSSCSLSSFSNAERDPPNNIAFCKQSTKSTTS